MQKTVFQTDGDGLYAYPTVANELALAPGHFNIPYGAYEDPPPEAPAGMVQRRVGALPWTLVEDFRTVPLWLVSTGEPYTLRQNVTVDDANVSYPGWGPLPTWLTQVEPPRPIEDAEGDA